MTSRTVWRAAQAAGMVLTLVLLVLLVVRPRLGLHLLWDMAIPLLPAVFLLNPAIWRNVCPLATLNAITGDRAGSRRLSGRWLTAAWLGGAVLLAALVPARRFLFNDQGAALAAVVAAVALLAVAAGLRYANRAGFCNAICPVLPVEKLYGQAPLIRVGNPRCDDCSLCVPAGCIDLAHGKAVAQTLGGARRHAGWLRTPFGAFAAAFPGFVLGYFTTTDQAPALAGAIYAHTALYAATSWLLVAAVVTVFRIRSALALPVLGALAFVLYYAGAAPGLADAYGAPEWGAIAIRVAANGLAAVWLWKALAGRLSGAPARARSWPS